MSDDSFVVDEAALETIAETTRRLDGIPLAIELAAAQTRTLTPTQILTHLDDRFQFLRRGNRQAPPRQRTLEAAVAWSYELLDSDEQRAFRWLTICAGQFALSTAARLLDIDEVKASLLLDALVTKSLIVPIRSGRDGLGYRFLETLRDYGRRELASTGELAAAKIALEGALLPLPHLLDDWIRFENEYLFADDAAIIVEDVTRARGRCQCARRGEARCGGADLQLVRVPRWPGRRRENAAIGGATRRSAPRPQPDRLARRVRDQVDTRTKHAPV